MNQGKGSDDERPADGRQSPRRTGAQPGAAPANTSRRIGVDAARPTGGPRQIEVTREVTRQADGPRQIEVPRSRIPRQAGPAPESAASPEAAPVLKDGWGLEQPQAAVPQQKGFLSRGGLRTIMIAGGGVLLGLIVLSMMLAPSGEGGVLLTKGDQQLLSDYRKYIAQANLPPADADRKISEAEQRLKAYRWADSVSDKERTDREYRHLLLLDADRGSPLYKYCVDKLRRK